MRVVPLQGTHVPVSKSCTVVWRPRNCSPHSENSDRAFPLANIEVKLPTREQDIRRFVVIDHYDAGQIIVRRGETIDVKDKVALDQLHEKLIPVELERLQPFEVR